MSFVTPTLIIFLPILALALALTLARRRRKQPGQHPAPAAVQSWSGSKQAVFGIAVLLVVIPLSGWLGGWSVESLLMPVGWLATGLALFLIDRFLDQRVQGKRPKLAGPLPFWWLLALALPLGWGYGMLSTPEDSPLPTMVESLVLLSLSLAALASFCLRFGLRPTK